jgi:hypothetical protein
LLLPSADARADASAADKAAAEVLFDQAKVLLGQGKLEEACRKFEGSQKLDPGIGTALFLADCYEKTGRSASAWALFREAAAMAKAAGQTDREEIARARAVLLESKVPKLVLVTDAVAKIPGLEIMRDGTAIPVEVGSAEVPVDPGKHVIEMRAPKKKAWSQTIDVPNTPDVQRVVLPNLEDEASVKDIKPQVPVKVEPNESGSNGRRTAGLVIGAVGIAGLGVSGVFTGIALTKDSEADKICNGSACPTQQGVDLGNDAKFAANVSTVAFGVGAAGLVVGTILFLTAPSRTPKKTSFNALMILPTPSGVVVTGRW